MDKSAWKDELPECSSEDENDKPKRVKTFHPDFGSDGEESSDESDGEDIVITQSKSAKQQHPQHVNEASSDGNTNSTIA